MSTGAAPADLAALTRDGIIAHRAAFDVAWVDRLHLDVLAAFEEARSRAGGAPVGGRDLAGQARMFPPREEWPRYQAASQLRMPQRGDVSARSAPALHRGTANHSRHARPVVVLGVIAPDTGPRDRHDITVTHDYWASLPDDVRRHLDARVVDRLEPVVQKHDIEGLVMGAAED